MYWFFGNDAQMTLLSPIPCFHNRTDPYRIDMHILPKKINIQALGLHVLINNCLVFIHYCQNTVEPITLYHPRPNTSLHDSMELRYLRMILRFTPDSSSIYLIVFGIGMGIFRIWEQV